jgi:hypothetical protein
MASNDSMQHGLNRSIAAFPLVVALGSLSFFAQGGVPAQPLDQEIQVAPPPFTEGIFPCSQCHDGKSMKVNPTPRKLTGMHEDVVLKHGPESRWCLDCHDAADRDQLHLASGERIDFSRSC